VSTAQLSAPVDRVAELLDRWRTVRAELRAIEQDGHPDLVDKFGRTWTWRAGDLYSHDSMAWPRATFEDGAYRLPTPAALANPNYDFCPICRGQAQPGTPPGTEPPPHGSPGADANTVVQNGE